MGTRTALGLGTAGLILLAAIGTSAAEARPTGTSPWTGSAAARATLDRIPTGAWAHGRAADGPESAALVNDEVAMATLDPTGLPERAVLISRVTATGERREVIDPGSQTNVRYLDRLGRPEVTPEGIVLPVGGERPSALTEARFDKPLPVALHVEYALDGRVVPAADVPGATADVTVTYTLTNTDSAQVQLDFVDASGQPMTSTRPVFAPFQGTVTVTLPSGTELVDPGGAVLATDAKGRTVARWNVSLYPPISTPIQRMGLVLRAPSAAIPAAEVVLTPIRSDQDPSDEFSASLVTGATEANEELFRGLDELDGGAAAVADGSDQLATGLSGLAGGAGQVADASATLAGGIADLAGGADGVADASAGLADGLTDLSGGAADLADGSTQLAGALDRSAAGADALATALAELAAATGGTGQDPVAPLVSAGEQIEAGLIAATARVGSPADPVLSLTQPIPPDGDDTCPAGGVAPPDDDCITIYQGVRLLRDGLVALNAVADAIESRAEAADAALDALLADLASIRDDVTTAAEGASELLATLCTGPTPTLDPTSCAQLQEVADAAAAALATGAGALPTIEELEAAIEALKRQGLVIAAALDTALASTERLLAGVEALGVALGQGTASQPGLTAGMSALNDGLRQLSAALSASQAQLTAALAEVTTGSATLAAGLGIAASGADDLADGSESLASGADRAADGADQLADGAGALADGASGAADGAGQVADGTADVATGAQQSATAGGDLATGAGQLRTEGTEPAAASVLAASDEPAEVAAWLAAADARAADALPYGPPAGGLGNVAYVFTLPEVAAPRSLWDRILGMFG
jgi:putative membrane protein